MSLPSRSNQEDSVKRITRVFQSEWPIFDPEFTAYEIGYNWLGGDQYTEGQKSWYKAQRRPTNVWNLIFPIYNRMLGEFLINQSTSKIYGRSGGTAKIADDLQKVVDSILINTDYKDEMGATILSSLIKRGCLHTRWSNERKPDGSILITNQDEFEIMFDSRAIDMFLRDARYFIRSNWMTVDQIMSLWPNHRSKLKQIMKDREDSAYFDSQDEFTETIMSHKDFADERNGKYRVVEFHDRESDQAAEMVYDPIYNQSQIITLEGKRRELFLKANPHLELVQTNSAEIISRTMVIPGLNFFLEKKDGDIQDGFFDYTLLHAYNYGKKVIKHYGVFQNAQGPQADFNDNRNRTADIINKSANAQTALKPGKITNYQDVKSHGAEPGLIIEVVDEVDISQVIKRFDPPSVPVANERMTETSQMLLDRIIGVTENLRGLTQSSSENASLFAQRVREASKSFAPIERNHKRVDAHVINRTIKLIQKHADVDTFYPVLMPSTGESETLGLNVQAGEQIINDVRIGEYYVFPSTEERNPIVQTVRFLEKTELIKTAVEIWGPMAADPRFWLENAPIEGVEKLIKKIEQAMGMQMQEQEKASAYQDIQNIMEGAGKQLALTSGGGQGQPGQPAPK